MKEVVVPDGITVRLHGNCCGTECKSVRVPNSGGLGCFLAVSLPRCGTALNKDWKGNEGRCGQMEQGIQI